MSENLIYGADILAYGAVPDGKTDCSDAFIKAIENGESLISVPYGTYLLTKPVELSSNVKLHLHPSACVKFVPSEKNKKPLFYSKDSGAIEICGGIFDIDGKASVTSVFCFDGCENVRITSCTINAPHALTSILVKGTKDICISGVTFNGMSDCIKLVGECENITFKNSVVKASANVLQIGEAKASADVSNLSVRNINVGFCDSFLEFLNGAAVRVSAENIEARVSCIFVNLIDFNLEDSEFENLKAYIVDTGLDNGKAKSYFCFGSCPDGLEIRNFERVSEMESTPFRSTLTMWNSNAQTAKLLIDGMSLDNIIASRGMVGNTVSMTAAKLSNPCNKYIYTLEVGVNNKHLFAIPLGGFDYMSINRH